jgi:DNA primase
LKDPADILKERGAEPLQKSMECFINDFEYLIHRGRTLFDISGAEGKARAVASLFPYVEILDSEVSKGACIGDIADAFGVERQAVLDDYRRFGRQADHSRNGSSGRAQNGVGASPEAAKARPVVMNDELFLLIAVVVNHALVPKLRSTLSLEELEDPGARELFIALEEWFRNEASGGEVNGAALPHELLSHIQDEGLRNFVLQQSASEAFSANPEQLFRDSIKRVRMKRLERRQKELIVALRMQNGGESGRRLDDLLAEKVHIDAELNRFKETNE